MRRGLRPLVFVFLGILLIGSGALRAQWIENGTEICTDPGYQAYQKIVSDGAAGAIVAWQDRRTSSGGYDDIYAQRIDAYGNVLWTTNGIPICTAAGTQSYVEMVADGYGGAVLTWLDSRGPGSMVYAQRIDSNGDTLWTGDGVAIQRLGGGWSHKIVSDNSGGAIIVWTDSRTGKEQAFAQRVNADGDTLWTGDGIRVCLSDYVQQYPRITTDGVHGAFLAWGADRGSGYNIYGQRINSSGTLSWGGGFNVCTYSEIQRYPVITTDEAGGAIVTWEDYRNETFYPDVYAGRFDSSGVYKWQQPVCIATNQQDAMEIVPDGAHGAIITWDDNRASDYTDIYVQRADASGNMLWTANGVAVCTHSGYQTFPVLVQSGMGGAVVAWADARTGSSDIYVQQLDGSGNVQWTSDGLALCNETGDQYLSAITSDGIGGGIVCWYDQRISAYDIYALRIERNGYWGYPCASIYDIEDVPGDQGGCVTTRWSGTRIDEYPSEVVTHYSVWRSLTGPDAMAFTDRGYREVDLSDVGPGFEGPAVYREVQGGMAYWWEWIGNMDAHYLDNYAMTCQTLYDSTGTGAGYHYFFVAAHTGDPFNYWDSPPDSGYSVDNLAPGIPLGLAGDQSIIPEGLELTWEPNTEPDLAGYRVYRGLTDDFTPGPGNLLDSPVDTMTFDGGWEWDSGYYYKVSAIDIHGNESLFALLGPTEVTGEDPPAMPLADYLSQNFPNPFNPVTTIAFGLKEPGYVRLRIYDVSGRLVRTLVNGRLEAKHYEVGWDGRDGSGGAVSSGVYFYSLITGNFRETRKMVLLR